MTNRRQSVALMPSNRRHRARGFTLMELMITVSIVGILSAIAYPLYTDQIAKGRRAEVKAALLDASQWMERFYAENYAYDKNTVGTAVTDSALFGGRYKQTPKSGSAAYTIGLEDLATRTYSVVATRTGAMAKDKCGDFVLTQSGARSLKNYASSYGSLGDAMADCWK